MITAHSHHKATSKANGTSLIDYIKISYGELVALFGQPTIKTDGYKTDAEWHVSFHGPDSDWTGPEDAFVTIYNFKNGKNYCGANGLNVEQITEWNVGGKARANLYMLDAYIEQQRESVTA